MTVPSEINRAGPYHGNGSTKVFSFGFKIVDARHLRVISRDARGDESTLILNADYTVSGVGNETGGSITTTVAPIVGVDITLLRNVSFTQETDLENQGAYYAETVEDAFDLAAMRDQQLKEGLDRAVKVPENVDPSGLNDLVADITRLGQSSDNIDIVANNIVDVNFVANNMGDVITVAGAVEELRETAQQVSDDADRAENAANEAAQHVQGVTPTVMRFSGDGAETEFDLGIDVLVENLTNVFITGVYQQKDTYDVIDGVLTFSSAPPVGADNIEVNIGGNTSQAFAIPSNGTVTPSKFGIDSYATVSTRNAVGRIRIDSSVSAIRTAGYYEEGDGGAASYRRVAYEPTHAGKVRSLDGAWWELAEKYIYPEMLGYVSGDAAPFINNAAIAALAVFSSLCLNGNKIYEHGAISIPANSKVITNGAELRSLGLLTGAQRDLKVGDGCVIDALIMTRPATGTNTYWCELGKNVKVETVSQIADAQWLYNGILTSGEGVRIGSYFSDYVERAFDAEGDSVNYTPGLRVGNFESKHIRRGILLRYQDDFDLGNFHFEYISDSNPAGVGVNPVLLGGSRHGRFGNIYTDVPCESAFRIGGGALDTHDIEVGDVHVVRSHGCAVKINPSGYRPRERAKRITIGHITGVDVGLGPLADNQELLRASHYDDVFCKSISSFSAQYPRSGQWALSLNDGTNLEVGSIRGKFKAGIRFNEAQDADNINSFGGDVIGVRIGEFAGSVFEYGSAITAVMPNFNIGDVYITGLDITGYTQYLAHLNVGGFVGSTLIQGRVSGTVAPLINGAPSSSAIVLDVIWTGNRRYLGRPDRMMFGSGFEVSGERFNPANTAPTGITLPGTGLTGGIGVFGRGLEFGKVGNAFRGAAVVSKQTGVNSFNMGLSVLVSEPVASSHALREAVEFDHFGNINLLRAGEGVTFISPDGSVKRKLTINNSGSAVWTSV